MDKWHYNFPVPVLLHSATQKLSFYISQAIDRRKEKFKYWSLTRENLNNFLIIVFKQLYAFVCFRSIGNNYKLYSPISVSLHCISDGKHFAILTGYLPFKRLHALFKYSSKQTHLIINNILFHSIKFLESLKSHNDTSK